MRKKFWIIFISFFTLAFFVSPGLTAITDFSPVTSFSRNVKASVPDSGEFIEVAASFPGIDWGSLAWGDYDNDGALDVLLTGYTNTNDVITKIYHNDGDGTFEDISIDLPGAYYSACAWGDYDNDGFLDVLLTGMTITGSISKIFHNNHNGTFTDINAGLEGVLSGSVAWGDYDNDGFLDILLTGAGGSGPVSKVYRNKGDSTFEDIYAGLEGVDYGSAAWGDYDNDGYLDIALTGDNNGGLTAAIYHNNHDGTFTDILADLMPLGYGSSVAWGDFDNDGDLDILLAGMDVYGHQFSKVYRNKGDSSFEDIGADMDLQGVALGSVAWGDYDSDGFLDIVLSGYAASLELGYDIGITKVYRNNKDGLTFDDIEADLAGVAQGDDAWGDFDNDGDMDLLVSGSMDDWSLVTKLYRNNLGSNIPGVNTPPYAPSNPQASVAGNNVTLSWSKAMDALGQTPQNGLNYNLFIGTTPNGVDRLSPMAQVPDGVRRIAAIGSQNENTSWTVKNLPDGIYCWGVQAIDTAFAGSAFVVGDAFTVGEYTISGTVSGLLPNNSYPVTITASGIGGFATLSASAAGGSYSITVPYGWTGSLVAASDAYDLSETPVATFVSPVTFDQVQDYHATLKTFHVSGDLLVPANNPYPVTVTATGTNGFLNYSMTTTATGYTLSGLPYGWTGTLSATSSAYTLTPHPGVSFVTPVVVNQNQSFLATLNTYTISGAVSGLLPNNTALYTITAQGTNGYADFSVTTPDAAYAIANVPYGWTGSLVATSEIYNLSETPEVTFSAPVISNQAQDYLATLKSISISGKVTAVINGVETGFAGVTLAADHDGGSATTDAGGNYTISNIPYGWSGIVMPHKEGCTFDPPSKNYANLSADASGQDYVAILGTFTISGKATIMVNGVKTGLAGVKILSSDGKYVTTSATGEYWITRVPYGWSGTLTPSKWGYAFNPLSRSFADVFSNKTNQDFDASLGTYTISGSVVKSNGDPVSGVTIIVAPNPPVPAPVTGPDGKFSFTMPGLWTGTVTASKPGYQFNPQVYWVGDLGANFPNMTFAAYPGITYIISGRVTLNGTSTGLGGVIVNAGGYGSAGGGITFTDSNGYYTLVSVRAGWTGTITPMKDGYKFTPASRSYINLNGNKTNQNYTAVH